MRSAQSRLGILASLDSTRRGVSRMVDAVPIPARVLKFGATAVASLAGLALLRVAMPRRRAETPRELPAAAVASSQNSLGRYLLTESFVLLLLPLCRRFFLGEGDGSLPSTRLGGLLDNLLKKGR